MTLSLSCCFYYFMIDVHNEHFISLTFGFAEYVQIIHTFWISVITLSVTSTNVEPDNKFQKYYFIISRIIFEQQLNKLKNSGKMVKKRRWTGKDISYVSLNLSSMLICNIKTDNRGLKLLVLLALEFFDLFESFEVWEYLNF